MELGDLNGRKLKKDLGADRCMKRYHNKHVDGSGNFGFTVWVSGDMFTIDGRYDTNKRVYGLRMGHISRGIIKAPLDYNQMVEQFKDLVNDWFGKKIAKTLTRGLMQWRRIQRDK